MHTCMSSQVLHVYCSVPCIMLAFSALTLLAGCQEGFVLLVLTNLGSPGCCSSSSSSSSSTVHNVCKPLRNWYDVTVFVEMLKL